LFKKHVVAVIKNLICSWDTLSLWNKYF